MESTGAIDFNSFKEEWLAEVRSGNPSTVQLGNRFAKKLLTQWLDIDDASDDLNYCDGAGDGGIDIAYLQRDEGGEVEGHTWYLVQSKYGSAFQGTNTLLEEGKKVIDTLDGKRTKLSSITSDLLERLQIFRQRAGDLDHIVLVFATENPLNDSQRQTLDDVRAMGQNRLGALFDTRSISVATIYESNLAENSRQLSISIDTSQLAPSDELLVMPISLLNLYAFLKAYQTKTGDLDQLYERNVRRFLGSLGKVNRGMQQTLQQEPERFGLYNNGITIVVADFRHGGEGTLELIEPNIVNGAQTSRTIWEVFRRKLEAGGTGVGIEQDPWYQRAKRGVVVAKIVKVGIEGTELLAKITRYTNSQNAVREKDFIALSSDFQAWSKEMATKYKIYLEIQRGGWDSRRALQKQKPSITQFGAHANAFDLLKVYGAGWLGEAGTAYGRNVAFLPNGTIFRRIVNNVTDDEPFGVDDLYAAYLLQQAADQLGFGRGAQNMSRRQTRFLFYMTVIELLRDIVMRASLPITHRNISNSMLKLFRPGNETAIQDLLNEAIGIIDDYFLQNGEDTVFDEPAFRNNNNDLNAYLKSEQLGKNEDSSPHYRALLALAKRSLAKSKPGEQSARDRITASIRG